MQTTEGKTLHIVVLGGGLAGLSASYDLAMQGHQVTLVETASDIGGLASSIKIEGQSVERFYHFICRSDRALINLIQELNISDKLHWRATKTAFYYNGKHYRFGRPIDLVRFKPVPWLQRFRFGFHILRSYYRSNWKWLDEIPAKAWLIENIGEEAYQAIWHPLLNVKFGSYHEKISAAWMWHRIWRVAQSRTSLISHESFGYLENGSATIIDELVKWLEKQPNAAIKIATTVQALNIKSNTITSLQTTSETIECDAVLSTIALPGLQRLLPEQSPPYFTKANQIQYIGVVCALLNLKHSFSPNFWLNVNDPKITFNGIIEQTNLNQNLKNAGLNILYVPFYLPTNERRYNATNDELFAEYIPMLKQLQPAFDESWIKERMIFRTPYAQAVCTTNFLDLIPTHRTPIRGLYLTDSTQFYPEDRTLSAAIDQGRKAAQLISEDML